MSRNDISKFDILNISNWLSRDKAFEPIQLTIINENTSLVNQSTLEDTFHLPRGRLEKYISHANTVYFNKENHRFLSILYAEFIKANNLSPSEKRGIQTAIDHSTQPGKCPAGLLDDIREIVINRSMPDGRMPILLENYRLDLVNRAKVSLNISDIHDAEHLMEVAQAMDINVRNLNTHDDYSNHQPIPLDDMAIAIKAKMDRYYTPSFIVKEIFKSKLYSAGYVGPRDDEFGYEIGIRDKILRLVRQHLQDENIQVTDIFLFETINDSSDEEDEAESSPPILRLLDINWPYLLSRTTAYLIHNGTFSIDLSKPLSTFSSEATTIHLYSHPDNNLRDTLISIDTYNESGQSQQQLFFLRNAHLWSGLIDPALLQQLIMSMDSATMSCATKNALLTVLKLQGIDVQVADDHLEQYAQFVTKHSEPLTCHDIGTMFQQLDEIEQPACVSQLKHKIAAQIQHDVDLIHLLLPLSPMLCQQILCEISPSRLSGCFSSVEDLIHALTLLPPGQNQYLLSALKEHTANLFTNINSLSTASRVIEASSFRCLLNHLQQYSETSPIESLQQLHNLLEHATTSNRAILLQFSCFLWTPPNELNSAQISDLLKHLNQEQCEMVIAMLEINTADTSEIATLINAMHDNEEACRALLKRLHTTQPTLHLLSNKTQITLLQQLSDHAYQAFLHGLAFHQDPNPNNCAFSLARLLKQQASITACHKLLDQLSGNIENIIPNPAVFFKALQSDPSPKLSLHQLIGCFIQTNNLRKIIQSGRELGEVLAVCPTSEYTSLIYQSMLVPVIDGSFGAVVEYRLNAFSHKQLPAIFKHLNNTQTFVAAHTMQKDAKLSFHDTLYLLDHLSLSRFKSALAAWQPNLNYFFIDTKAVTLFLIAISGDKATYALQQPFIQTCVQRTIKHVINFRDLIFNKSVSHQQQLINSMAKQLPKLIRCTSDISTLMRELQPELKAQVFTLIEHRLQHLLQRNDNIGAALQHLPADLCTRVIDLAGSNLALLIRKHSSSFWQYQFSHLSQATQANLCHRLQDGLSHTISSFTALLHAIKFTQCHGDANLSYSTFRSLIELIPQYTHTLSQFSQLLALTEQLDVELENINNEAINEDHKPRMTALLDALWDNTLPRILHKANNAQILALIPFFSSKLRVRFANDFRYQIARSIHTPRQLNDTLNQLPDEQRALLIAEIGLKRLKYITRSPEKSIVLAAHRSLLISTYANLRDLSMQQVYHPGPLGLFRCNQASKADKVELANRALSNEEIHTNGLLYNLSTIPSV